MTSLSDEALDHLRRVADWPEFRGDRYRAVELLGTGGMGSVYLVEDRELARHVAVKVLREVGPDAGAATRLLQEARILGRLEHPGIVPIHDVGTLVDGRCYYVMKLVRGERLDRHVSRGSASDLLRVFERVCETVAFAHAHGVVHRDLKPDNVMVGEFGEVLVLDWGVAKLLDAAQAAPRRPVEVAPTWAGGTRQGTVLGTPGYMAPEQERGDVERIDARTDVYALGALLRFLLTRLPPPAGTDLQEARRTRRIPRRLEAICRKAQAVDPADRYAGVTALAAEIARFRAGEPIEAYHEGPLERLARIAHRYRVPILLVLAYLAMRILLIWWGGL